MTRANFIGAPAYFNLTFACQALTAAFGYHVYLVGSVMERRDFRDVDVRCILEDEVFAAEFPDSTSAGAKLPLLNAAISEWLASRCGLNIDFQFQQRTKANAEYEGKKRSGLGLFMEAKP